MNDSLKTKISTIKCKSRPPVHVIFLKVFKKLFKINPEKNQALERSVSASSNKYKLAPLKVASKGARRVKLPAPVSNSEDETVHSLVKKRRKMWIKF